MAIHTPLGLLPLLPSPQPTGESLFLPLGTGLPQDNFEKIGVVRVYSEALETWSAASLQLRFLFSSGRSSSRRTVAVNYRPWIQITGLRSALNPSMCIHHAATTRQ